MESVQYFKMTECLNKLTSKMGLDLIENQRTMSVDDLLLVLFDTVPEYRFLGTNDYHKSGDKSAYKQETIDIVSHMVSKRYVNHIGKEYTPEVDLILKGLFDGGVTIGQTVLQVPKEMTDSFKRYRNNIQDGKQVIIAILNHWHGLIIQHEKPEAYKSAEKNNTSSQDTKTFAKTPIKMQSRDEIDAFYPDYDDHGDRDTSYEYDDDGSNWAYNERHDK